MHLIECNCVLISYNLIRVFLTWKAWFPCIWDGKILCGEQGGIDENEDPRDAAIRELREETGITSAEVLAEVWTWDLTP